MRPLPVRPRPVAYEPLGDYLGRLACANGYAPGELWPVLAKSNHSHVEVLRRALAMSDLPVFSGPAVRGVDIPVEFYGLRQQDFVGLQRKWCPHCIEEATWTRPVWRLKVAAVCSRHQVRLLQQCPRCGIRPEMQSLLSGTCECGFHYGQGVGHAPKSAVHLAKMLEASLSGPAPLDMKGVSVALTLPQIVRAIHYLGRVIEGPGLSRPGQVRHLEALDVASKYFEGTATLLADWPNAYWHCLEDYLEQSPLDASVRRVFGSLYHVIYQDLRDPEFQFLRDAFELFLLDRWRGELCGRHRLFSEETILAHPTKGVARVARVVGVGGHTIRRMVSQGLVSPNAFKSSSKRKLITINEDQLRQFIPDPADYLNLRSAARLLGVERTRVRQLVAGGVLQADIQPEWSKRSQWLFRKNVLIAFVNQIRSRARRADGTKECVTFGHILQYWQLIPAELCALMRAVMAGDLTFALAKRATLRDMVFEKAEIRTWLERYRASRTDWVSLQEAGRRLGVKDQVLYQLVASNMLVVDLVLKGSNNVRRVSQSSIEQFRSEFVSLAELASKEATSATALLRRLKAVPVMGPRVDGGRQYFFRRQDV